jgi:hypothetical protein
MTRDYRRPALDGRAQSPRRPQIGGTRPAKGQLDRFDERHLAESCPAFSLCKWLLYYGDCGQAYNDWSMYWTPARLRRWGRL